MASASIESFRAGLDPELLAVVDALRAVIAGAHAELVAVPVASLVARVPDGWRLADAAPGMEGAHYAHAFLRVTGLGPGDRALVHGATGAIGTAAVQLLRAAGVEVTAVCDRLPPDCPELVSELGATRVIDLSECDRPEAAGNGFDAVLDAYYPYEQVLQNAPDSADGRFRVTAILGEEQ